MSYLTLEDRIVIQSMIDKGEMYKDIAKVLKRAPSSVSYEVSRNSVNGVYNALRSQEMTRYKLKNRHLGKKKAPSSNVKVLDEALPLIEARQSLNSRITLNERHIIARLVQEGRSCGEIGKLIGRGKNTIVQEIRKNGGRFQYNPEQAQAESDMRHELRNSNVSAKLKNHAKGDEYFNPYTHLRGRIENLEMQIEILTETIRKLTSEH
jgi:IS30 family transposase